MRATLFLLLVAGLSGCGEDDDSKPNPQMSARESAAVISEVAMQTYFVKIKMAARRYQAQNGSYPDNPDQMVEQGLLDEGSARDPWGNPWVIEVIDGNLTVTSYGLDGKPGGTEENRDRVSR